MNRVVIGLLIFALISIIVYIILSNLTAFPDGLAVVISIIAGALGEWVFYKQKS